MKTKFNITKSNIGVVGDNATLQGVVFTKTNSAATGIDYVILMDEIQRLKSAYETLAQRDEEILKEIRTAEEAAKVKDFNTIMEKLKLVGQATFKLAKDIGVNLVSSLIAKQIEI